MEEVEEVVVYAVVSCPGVGVSANRSTGGTVTQACPVPGGGGEVCSAVSDRHTLTEWLSTSTTTTRWFQHSEEHQHSTTVEFLSPLELSRYEHEVRY